MDTLLAFTNPIALIPLFILAGGVILYILVGLGGWGERTLSDDSKVFLSILGTVFTVIGLGGIILVVYPVLRPNVILVQQDLNLPNPLSTPIPKPTPTPLSTAERLAQDVIGLGGSFAMVLIFVAFGIMMIRFGMASPESIFNFLIPKFPKLPTHDREDTPRPSRSVTYKSDGSEEE